MCARVGHVGVGGCSGVWVFAGSRVCVYLGDGSLHGSDRVGVCGGMGVLASVGFQMWTVDWFTCSNVAGWLIRQHSGAARFADGRW
jgi:hypothetical protein